MRVHCIALAEILIVTASASAYYYYWPQFPVLPSPQISPKIRHANGCSVISWPGRYLVGKLAGFDEELSAYLMFDYLRSRESLRGRNVLLTTDRMSKGFSYRISAHLPDDVLAGVEELAELRGITSLRLSSIPGLHPLNSLKICAKQICSFRPTTARISQSLRRYPPLNSNRTYDNSSASSR
jgi:hypothetical protein